MKSLILDARQLIKNANDNIENNIAVLCPDHIGLCAQNILSQTRNLIDGIALFQYREDKPFAESTSGSESIKIAISNLKQKDKRFKPFIQLYRLLEIVSSHFTQNMFDSEALLFRYANLLYEIKKATMELFNIKILNNLDDFPFNEKRDDDYYRAIKQTIENKAGEESSDENTYYIERKVRRKFGIYEYVLSPANDKRTKFDRLTVYSSFNINENNSIMCSLIKHKFNYKGIIITISYVRQWFPSIRPCELNKLAFIQGINLNTKRSRNSYISLMNHLSIKHISLYDFVTADSYSADVKELNLSKDDVMLKFLNETHTMINSDDIGSKTLRYLVYICRHEVIKHQIAKSDDRRLGTTFLDKGCFAFDSHPFSFSLIKHNPSLASLLECLPDYCTNEELLKRTIVSNTENKKKLYTPLDELDKMFLTNEYIDKYNCMLVSSTRDASIDIYDKYAYIRSYENHTISILKRLIEKSTIGDDDYIEKANKYIESIPLNEIDDSKKEILKNGFINSSVLLINGAAGTGKTTLIKHFSNVFKDKKILFLSSTNSSVQNLRIKIGKCENRDYYDFLTLEKYKKKSSDPRFKKYSVLVVDECSMVENDIFDDVLRSKEFSKMILVGDEKQIESIRFGNWFGIANKVISNVYELTYNHRTSDQNLELIWNIVRELKDKDTIPERIVAAGYHHELDNSLFVPSSDDEVILCLNYDGLYGINNINKYLQETNSGKSVSWKVWTFKEHDKILFNESYYFREFFYNNQKGVIEEIDNGNTFVSFVVSVVHEQTNNRGRLSYVSWIKEENGRDYYKITIDKDDDDDEDNNTQKVIVVPFQLGYAISIHKSQGLEYESVKVVLTREVEEHVSHNIFYTAITRSKKYLTIYCDLNSLSHIVNRFEKQEYDNDAVIIRRKYGI